MRLIKKTFRLNLLSRLSLKLNNVKVIWRNPTDLIGQKTTLLASKKNLRTKLRKENEINKKKNLSTHLLA